ELRLDRRRYTRAPDAKRTDAHAHRRLFRLHATIKRLDKAVDILAPPIRTAQPARHAIALPRRVIGKLRVVLCGIGIEVIVDMNAVDVVTLHDVEDHLEDVTVGVHLAGIDPL